MGTLSALIVSPVLPFLAAAITGAVLYSHHQRENLIDERDLLNYKKYMTNSTDPEQGPTEQRLFSRGDLKDCPPFDSADPIGILDLKTGKLRSQLSYLQEKEGHILRVCPNAMRSINSSFPEAIWTGIRRLDHSTEFVRFGSYFFGVTWAQRLDPTNPSPVVLIGLAFLVAIVARQRALRHYRRPDATAKSQPVQ